MSGSSILVTLNALRVRAAAAAGSPTETSTIEGSSVDSLEPRARPT
jgi:hypothetical protein